jgi:hypothetical protein
LAYSELHFKLFLATGLFAMFLSFVWLLGIISIFKVEKELELVYFPNLTGRFGFESLMLFFVLLSVLVVMMFFLGVGSLVSLKVSHGSLTSMFEDKKVWAKSYGKDTSLESVQTLSSGYFTIVAFVSMACSVVLALVLRRGFQIAATQAKDRTPSLFMVFNSFLLPMASSAFLYVALAASIEMRDLPIVGTRYMPDMATGLFVVASIVIFLLSFVGLYAVVKESRGTLNLYKTGMGITALVVLAACVVITLSSFSFPSYYEDNWAEVMVQVDKAHFTSDGMGCYGGKYLRGINSTNLYDLPCEAKSQIAYVWEIDYFKDIGDHETLFSCLNPACKPVFGSWMSGKLGYLNIISWTTLVIILVCIYFSL